MLSINKNKLINLILQFEIYFNKIENPVLKDFPIENQITRQINGIKKLINKL